MTADKPPFDPVQHRRGGRPRLPDEERRDLSLEVRLSPVERAHADAVSARTGLSLSEFVRSAFNGAVEIVTTQEASPEVVRQLRLLNANVNQLLHEARRSPVQLPNIENAAVDALQTVRDELRTLLHGPECN